jgi:hypothetical protein
MHVSTIHPVFDRFIEQFRKTQEILITQIRQEDKHIQLPLLESIHDNNSQMESCKRVILMESAIAMLDDIMASPMDYDIPEECSDFKPDPSPVWIEIGAPKTPPFYDVLGVKVRGAFLDAMISQECMETIKKNVPGAQYAFVAIESVFEPFRRVRDFSLIAEDGSMLFGFAYDVQQQHWAIREEHRCPYRLCRQEQEGIDVQPCQRCLDALGLFSSWFQIVWASLQGTFRENDDEVLVQGVRGHERGKGNPKKTQTIHTEHGFHVIRTVDISVKPPKRPHDEDKQEEPSSPRSSWVKKAEAIDPHLVYHDVRTVPEKERTLSHPRYANYIKKHGNKVKVKAHTKSFPMLNNHMRMIRAKAKLYEGTQQ